MTEIQEWHFGFKRITVENAFLPDDIYESIGIGKKNLEEKRAEFTRQLLEPQVAEHVPEELRSMFEIARGACIYGIAFYPLNHVGEHQLYLCIQAAFVRKSRLLIPSRERWSFRQALKCIHGKGLLEGPYGFWESFVNLRNLASHAESATIHLPGEARRLLHDAAHILNHLWGPDGRVPMPPRPRNRFEGVAEAFFNSADA